MGRWGLRRPARYLVLSVAIPAVCSRRPNVARVVSSRVITGAVATFDHLVMKRRVLNSDAGSLLHNDVAQDAEIFNGKIAQSFRLDRSLGSITASQGI
jgi:hypothetical protein